MGIEDEKENEENKKKVIIKIFLDKKQFKTNFSSNTYSATTLIKQKHTSLPRKSNFHFNYI